MSTGVFGSIRPANVNITTDVDLLYFYRPSRGETAEDFAGFKTLDANECLSPTVMDEDENILVNGMYNLKLPVNEFNRKGIYTVYIRPKERKTKIIDVSVLATYPDVRGVVLNLLDESLAGISDLTGYRIDYPNGVTRLIKSCNYCYPVVVNTGDGYPKSTRYNIGDSSNGYVFCTVSPSSAPSFRPNSAPYIGEPGVEVSIVNTKFTPKMIEIEMVNHDADTISYMLEGDVVNDRDNAIITTFNDDKEIYHQAEYYVEKDKLGNPLRNSKKKRDNIDYSQDYNNVF